MAAKTAQQRAQEALDVAERRVAKLTEKYKQAKAEVERLDAERDRAVQRRDYVAKHPDLESNGIITLPGPDEDGKSSFESSHKDKP